MSTRVDGAAPAVIVITAKATLAVGERYLTLTVTQESGTCGATTYPDPRTPGWRTGRSSSPAI
jgi:hypothetical protein